MATQINVGDGSVSTAQNLVMLCVRPGDTVNISNLTGSSTLNYYVNGIDQAPATLTATNNVNVTGQAWIASQGVSTVLLTGGIY